MANYTHKDKIGKCPRHDYYGNLHDSDRYKDDRYNPMDDGSVLYDSEDDNDTFDY